MREKDRFDYKRDAIISYELNNTNTLVYDEKEERNSLNIPLKISFLYPIKDLLTLNLMLKK